MDKGNHSRFPPDRDNPKPERDPVRMKEIVRAMASLQTADKDGIDQIISGLLGMISDALDEVRHENPRFRDSDCLFFDGDKPALVHKREANTFLCACFLEYRSGKTDVWDNAAYFTEEILDDPDDIWQSILDHTYDGWKERFFDYNLHPEINVHIRLYRIANLMERFYSGDGRNIWTGFEDEPESVYKRLLILQIPRSIACLIVGLLKNCGFITGPFDIVGDIVDSRVLGRMICGDGGGITPNKARRLARMLAPHDPWDLDRPLYLIGSSWCGPGPKCRACPVKGSCVYALSDSLGIRPDPVFRDLLFGKKTVQRTLKRWQELPVDSDNTV